MTVVDRIVLHTAPGVTRVLFLAQGNPVEIWVEGDDAPGLVGGIAVVIARRAGGAAIAELPTGSGYIRDTRPGDGERVLVEVMRDGGGAKRAVLRQRVELAGEAVVLTPHHNEFGIASSIRAKGRRSAIKAALQPLLPPGVGAMVRSAAGDRSPVELADELLRLVAVWESITNQALVLSPPAWLVPPAGVETRAKALAPDAEIALDRTGEAFRDAGGEEALDRALARRVPVSDGVELVIEEAEAATLIDVNVASSPRGDALVGANAAAVKAVADIVRLRGLRGMILVDLPRMRGHGDRDVVAEALRAAVEGDPAPWQVLGWTPGGMLECLRECPRRSVSQEMLAPVGEPRLSVRTRAWRALDGLRREVGGIARPRLRVPADVAGWLDGAGAAIVAAERKRLGALTVVADRGLGSDEYVIDGES